MTLYCIIEQIFLRLHSTALFKVGNTEREMGKLKVLSKVVSKIDKQSFSSFIYNSLMAKNIGVWVQLLDGETLLQEKIFQWSGVGLEPWSL